MQDAYGAPVADTDAAALAEFDAALAHWLRFRPGVMSAAARSIEADPRFILGHVLNAYLGVITTEADDAAAAHEAFDRVLRTLDVTALPTRERLHVEAADAWLRGDMSGAGNILARASAHDPRDVLALAIGHQIDFFLADATMLRDRVGGALGAWRPDDADLGYLLGMYAFGLEEAGHYGRAEDVGLAAVDANPDDVWGIHAVVHTYEMQGRFGDGRRYMDARREQWTTGNFFNVHNWWHYALYALESDDVAGALSIYDAVLHNDESDNLAMEMLDAAALLWRLELEGQDTGGRWASLADAWTPTAERPGYYAFNDSHAAMALAGAGRHEQLRAMIRSRQEYAASPDVAVTNLRMTAEVGLPVMEAYLAFSEGRYDAAVDLLLPIRHRVNLFGGSHAQRDAVQRTLIESALRSGRTELARQLISERINIKPCSPYNWLKQAVVAEQLGHAGEAALARRHASDLRRAADEQLSAPPAPVGVGSVV